MKTYDKYGRLITVFTFFILVLSIFIPSIYAGQTLQTGFEDGTVASDYSNGWLTTDEWNGDTFEVDDTNPFAGNNCFRIYDGSTTPAGYWNFTTADDITQFTAYIEFDNDNADVQFYFYDSDDTTVTLGAEGTMVDESIIAMQLDGDGANPEVVSYADNTHTWRNINDSAHGLTTFIGIGYIEIGFTINSNNNVTYWYGDNTTYGTPANPTKITNGFGIDSIFIKGSSVSNADLDNLVIKTGDITDTGGDETIPVDFDYYNETYGDYFVEINKNWIDCYYSVNDYPEIVYRLPYNTSCTSYYYTCMYLYNVSLVYQDGTILYSRVVSGHNETVLGQNYVGKLPYLGVYWLEVYNATLNLHGNGSDPQTLFYISDPIRVCDFAEANSYSITITPDKSIYSVNDTVNIQIVKTGEDLASYGLYEPYLNNPEVAGDIYGTTVNFNYTFSDAWPNIAYCRGDWVLKVYDAFGSPQDDNAVNLVIKVAYDDVTIGELTEEQFNFIMGFTIILIFIFMGVGIASRLSGDAQIGIILLMAVMGSIITQLWSLIPLWIPFLIGMLFAGYIVKELYS